MPFISFLPATLRLVTAYVALPHIGGTGLGLPIIRQIMELHSGKVWATSTMGAGSTFHVMFPLAANVEATEAECG